MSDNRISEKTIINLSGYRFVQLDELERLQEELKKGLAAAGVKGAVILAEEGINVTSSISGISRMP